MTNQVAQSDQEKDSRLEIMNSFLVCPHRDKDEFIKLHGRVVSTDPYFYPRLATWYFKNGEVKDHKEIFAATLLNSPELYHRDVGYCLLQTLPPYQASRTLTQMKKSGRVTRVGKTAFKDYLRKREANDKHFDSAAAQGGKYMKHMYASLHIKPSLRADQILFKSLPPEDSMSLAIKKLAQATDSLEQAKIIIDNKIPYTVAVGAVNKVTAPVLVALLNAMTPAEVINNMSSLNEKGALDHPDVKQMVDLKLKQAQKDNRVSTFKAQEAAKAAPVSAEVKAQLNKVTDTQIAKKGKIKIPTAVFIDKSGSMDKAIELGKRLSALVSGISEADLYVYAFDSAPFRIQRPQGDSGSVTAWEKPFQGIIAGGNTCAGAPFLQMIRNRERVDQIIIITDEGENQRPMFVEGLLSYAKELSIPVPNVIILRVGSASAQIQTALKRAGLEYEAIDFNGDYYALPNLVPMLTKSSKLDLLLEILSIDLPSREAVLVNA